MISGLAPASYEGAYHEPFLGSGSIFFALHTDSRTHYLSDALEPLVNCYRQIAKDPLGVARLANSWDTTREHYYKVRSTQSDDDAFRAAQFLYFNRLCFNGLYRVNGSGQFNVPYGRPRSRTVVTSEDSLVAVSNVLNTRVNLRTLDFRQAINEANRGDFVFVDPPYIAGHRQNGFVDYNARVFSWADQESLARVVRKASRRGVSVLLSNANHSSIRQLYPDFYIAEIDRFSSMSSKVAGRGKSGELLISNYEIGLANA